MRRAFKVAPASDRLSWYGCGQPIRHQACGPWFGFIRCGGGALIPSPGVIADGIVDFTNGFVRAEGPLGGSASGSHCNRLSSRSAAASRSCGTLLAAVV